MTRRVLGGIGGNGGVDSRTILCEVGTRSHGVRVAFTGDKVPRGIVNNGEFFSHGRVGSIVSCFTIVGGPTSGIHLREVVGIPGENVNSAVFTGIVRVTAKLNLSTFRIYRHTSRFRGALHDTRGLRNFTTVVERFRSYLSSSVPLSSLLRRILSGAGCFSCLSRSPRSTRSEGGGVGRLSSVFVGCRRRSTSFRLSSFLRSITLITSVSSCGRSSSTIILVALRSTGKLRFPVIFVPKVRRDIFPNGRSIFGRRSLRRRHHLTCINVAETGRGLCLLGTHHEVLCNAAGHGRTSHFLHRVPMDMASSVAIRDCIPRSGFNSFARPTRDSSSSTTRGFNRINNTSTSTRGCSTNSAIHRGTFNANIILSTETVNGSAVLRITFSHTNAGGLVTGCTGLRGV